jgi:hypothetical protein
VKTLIDVIQADIVRSGDPQGPDWLRVVEDAVLAQDAEWVLADQVRTERGTSGPLFG